MSNDKAVESGKLKREPYRRSKRFDKSCRNHGSCGYCQGNRQHSNELRERIAQEKLEDFLDEMPDSWDDLEPISTEDIPDDSQK